MKTESLLIEFDWLERQTGSEIDRAFFADIGLAVGSEFLTRLEDVGAKTVRDRMRGCAYHLATWLAANWWRLRWEPEPEWRNTDWRMAHTTAAAGGGYVWPNVTFASEGQYLNVTTSPRSRNAIFEPIRYLNRVQTRIAGTEFEQTVDTFMEAVLSRLHSAKIKDGLPDLWADVLAERYDLRASRWRQLEAMAGFEPEKGPEEPIAFLVEDPLNLGTNGVEELAAEARRSLRSVVEQTVKLFPSGNYVPAGGYHALIQVPDLGRNEDASEGMPWEQGARLAKRVRDVCGLGKEPIYNDTLSQLLGVTPEMFTGTTIVPTKMPIAVKGEKIRALDIYFDRPRPTTRRFAASRMLGDYLSEGHEGRLIPATHAKTLRQKFQRSFAQEFLCPIDALLEKIQTQHPDEDDLAEAAAYFDVSPLMVTATLVNHGKLERDALDAIE